MSVSKLTYFACYTTQVKKILEGSIENCQYIEGVVCTKNVAHKKMRAKINSPRLLLLSSSLE